MDNIFNKGDTVYNPKGNIVVLSERVSEGGEGTIYLTDQPNLVAKIYHPDRLTQERYEKLSLMIVFCKGNFPTFAKVFSPGTDGEFLCQPDE